jgi:cell division protein FtsL
MHGVFKEKRNFFERKDGGKMSVNHARNWRQMYPQEIPKPNQQVKVKVRTSGWITKGEKVIYSFICLLFICFGIFIVSYSSSLDQLNREVQTIESKVQEQQIKNEGLTFEKKELSRPERIISIAEKNGLKIQDTKVKQAKELTRE